MFQTGSHIFKHSTLHAKKKIIPSATASMCQCLGHYDKFLQLKSIKLMWNVQLFKPSMNISDGKRDIYLYEHAY